MSRTNVTETPKRAYWTTCDNGLWSAHYQPKNPKTGKPWQAPRRIMRGVNRFERGNWETKRREVSNVKFGKNWTEGGFNWQAWGFQTEADALYAIEYEKRREKGGSK